MKKFTFVLIAVSTLTLAACGNTRGERVLTGAGLGAGAGALGNAAIGGSPWTGAAIGGVIGGTVGAVN